MLHAPRRDEVSPLGLVGVGRACGPLWRLLQRLGVEDRLPVAMLHAVEPVVVGQPPRRRLGRARLAVHLVGIRVRVRVRIGLGLGLRLG